MVSSVRSSLRKRAHKMMDEVGVVPAKVTGVTAHKNARTSVSEPANVRNVKEEPGQKGHNAVTKRTPTPRVTKEEEQSLEKSCSDVQLSKRGRPPKPKNNLSISTCVDGDSELVPIVPDQGVLGGSDGRPFTCDQVPKGFPRKRGRPRKYPVAEDDVLETPLKPFDSNERLSIYPASKIQITPHPKRRCEDCNAILKAVPANQMLCNDCRFDPLVILDDECDDDYAVRSRKKSMMAFENRNGRKTTRTHSYSNENEMPSIMAESPRPNEKTLDSLPPSLPFSRVNSPTPSSNSYVSDFDGPLPKRFPCPSTGLVPEQQYYNQQAAYFYPSPAALDQPLDRMEFMISRIHEMDQFQLAQVLCSLDIETRREFDRALQIRRDANLDMAMLNNETWSSICSIFANHMD
jgi:hypothetical protein